MNDHPQHIFTAASIPAAVFTASGEAVWVNRAFERCTGYALADLKGPASWPFLDSGGVAPFAAMLRRALTDDPGEPCDIPVLCRDRTVKNVRWTAMAAPKGGDPGRAYAAVLGMENIPSGRIRLGEAAEGASAAPQSLDDILQAAVKFSIVASTPEGTITAFSRGAEQMLGYASEEVVGRATPLIFHLPSELAARSAELSDETGDTVEGFRIFTLKAERDGAETREWTFVRKDGATLPVSLTVTAIHSPSGEVTGFLGIAHDIAGQKQAEEMFSKVFMTVPIGITISRMSDGVIVDRNPGFVQISGWQRHEVVGRTAADVNFWVDPEDRAALIEDLKAGRDVLQREYLFRNKEGDVRTGVFSARSVRINGEAHIIFVTQDVTERRETERRLRENEERLRVITSNMPGVIFQFYVRDNGEYGLSYISERLPDLFGIPLTEPEASFPAFLSRIHEEDLDGFLNSIGQAAAQVAPWNYTGRLSGPGGETTWFQAMSVPTRHEDRFVFDGIMLNVTERKRAEAMSRQSEEKFSKVFMTAPDFMAITRMSDGHIMDVNLGFEDLTGWKRNEVIGRTSADLDFWVDPDERANLIADLKAGRDVNHQVFKFRRKDGTLRDGVYSARSIEIGGEACLVFIMQDVTEHRRLEEERHKLSQQLFQSQKMEAVGTLAGGIAHDFNNILAGIIGYTELHIDELKDRPKIHRSMEKVLLASNRAKELVKQILTFSRKADQEKQPLVLAPIVDEVVKFMRASLPTTIEIRQTGDETTEAVMGDPSQMHQVLMNLCTNAGHAMKETGGVLEIGLREIPANPGIISLDTAARTGRRLEISVRDTGHGIPRENMERIFEPYFTTKEMGEGSGLGLAVVHGIVKDHGGDIRVYSEEGKGTVFRIYLPLIGKKADAQVQPEEAITPGDGETILFVDDEQIMAELNRELLTNLGYEVVTTTDPKRAIALFEEDPARFDLIITDKTMPGMTGFDLARKIRRLRPDIPVLLCSGFQEKGDLGKVEELGLARLLVKPIRVCDLSRAVRTALEKQERHPDRRP